LFLSSIPIDAETLARRFAEKNTWTSGPHIPAVKKKVAADDSYSSLYPSSFRQQQSVGPPEVRGAVGLRNLGNTCFLASTLQCLANTPGLTEFFVEGQREQQCARSLCDARDALVWDGRLTRLSDV